MEKQSFSDGFSLIELAIVLCVIGVIGGLSLPFFSQQINLSKQKVSVTNHDHITRSLAAYTLQNGRLPYAADPSAQGDAFGKLSKRFRGIVPFKALGLDENTVKDGFKNYITYVVDKALCQTTKLMNKPSTSNSTGGLGTHTGNFGGPGRSQVIDFETFCYTRKQHLKITTSHGVNDNKAFVLISHGPGGHGAYQCNGTFGQKRAPFFGTNEDLNAKSISGDGDVFYKFRYSTNKDNPFRHYVTSTTRYNLMAIYAQHPCRK